jgi:hypothetical protein
LSIFLTTGVNLITPFVSISPYTLIEGVAGTVVDPDIVIEPESVVFPNKLLVPIWVVEPVMFRDPVMVTVWFKGLTYEAVSEFEQEIAVNAHDDVPNKEPV